VSFYNIHALESIFALGLTQPISIPIQGCMSFAKPFWNNLPRHSPSPSSSSSRHDDKSQRFDFIGHASSEHGKDILFFNLKNAPILVAIYGGSDYSKQVEDMKDDEVVTECMKVLRKICEKAIMARDDTLRTRRQVDLTIPDWPIDYFVSRWGSDPYSRGAFCYVPNGKLYTSCPVQFTRYLGCLQIDYTFFLLICLRS
jgi:hypothetical protein